MADDDTPDVENLEEDEDGFTVDEPDGLSDEFEADESVEALAESEDADDDDDEEAPPKSAKAKPEEEDDDDEDDDDVEADLGEILKDRIAAGDDDDDDEDEVAKPTKPLTDIAPKRADEWTCDQCFFIVSKNQFGSRDNPRCPQGEEPCPSIARAFA